MSAYFATDQVIAQSGETQVYTLHNATHAHDQERHFCRSCGTTLFWFVSTLPGKIGVAGGCFPDGTIGEPTYSTNERTRNSWVSLPEQWEGYAG